MEKNYHMQLRFVITEKSAMKETPLWLSQELTGILNSLGMQDGRRREMVLEQTIPFIPDQKVLAAYENLILQGLKNEGHNVISVQFSGYDFFEEVTIVL